MHARKRSIVAIVAVLITGTLLGSDARAVTDTVFKYSEPKTGHMMLGPPDFAPYSGNLSYSINEGLAISATSNNEVCLYASVHLPQSATITQMRAFYGRPGAGDVLFVVLRRLNAAPAGIVTVANYPPAAAPLTQRGSVSYAAEPGLGDVNNARYRYYVELCLSNNAVLSSVLIEYTYKTAGD